jgi:hypothetical protein
MEARAQEDMTKAKSEADKAGKIERDFEANKDTVIDELLERIMEVNLEVPLVVKGKFE